MKLRDVARPGEFMKGVIASAVQCTYLSDAVHTQHMQALRERIKFICTVRCGGSGRPRRLIIMSCQWEGRARPAGPLLAG